MSLSLCGYSPYYPDHRIVRQQSVRGKRYHYIRTFTEGAGFTTLNRYKEKCFLVKPLMRELFASGELTGPSLDLMKPFPWELLFDTVTDSYEIHNLSDSNKRDDQEALATMRSALDTWIVETGDRGYLAEPPGIVKPFVKELHDWFGTPTWYLSKE